MEIFLDFVLAAQSQLVGCKGSSFSPIRAGAFDVKRQELKAYLYNTRAYFQTH